MKKMIVAIDGPAAAGKSTIAKKVASILGYTYVDTGAMYRAFTYYVLKNGIDPKDESASIAVIKDVDIKLEPNGKVLCNDEDVTAVIRSNEVSQNVSFIASYKEIRLELVKAQRKMAESVSVVMDGRDIGTYVLPNANVKIYQVASVKARAERRFKENIEKGIPCTIEQLEKDIERRDYIDSHRDFAPLKQAEDAILLDTSDMTIDEVVNKVLEIIKEKAGN
ncbi:MAG: (d)CMP kinase [Erysipelotrichales bacterium]|nr:(d)CMP kinase [Erysipelotrichales bacterium]